MKVSACFLSLLFLFNVSDIIGMALTDKVAIIGATGKLGRAAVYDCVKRGIPIKCLLRREPPPEFLTSIDSPKIEFVKGDVTNKDSLKELLTGCSSCLALFGATRRSKISDIWTSPNVEDTDFSHAKQINYVGVKNIIDAAKDSKTCKRIVRITGKGEDPWSFFSILINMFGSCAKGWNYEGEELLRNQVDIDYTIIRPGIMKEEVDIADPKNEYTDEDKAKVLGLKDNGGDMKVSAVPYKTIASLCIDCLSYDNTARSTLTAMNVEPGKGESSYEPLLQKVQTDSRIFPTNLIEEHKKAVRFGVSVLFGFTLSLFTIFLSIIKSLFF